ncbi:O-antigen conversion protein [Komagataeibacter diospyri]|uniref:O-antigen conversion protein n=2 Tax=Komagataeibacter diospyri TaxID=1932662 RepID=A0A4V0WML8_9PROT|nr:O-antigen conversion protein [Komagataeibacter diospyri]
MFISKETPRNTAISSFFLCRREFYTRAMLFFLVFILFTYPIIHANVYYADDTLHALSNIHWERDGRVLGQLLLLFMGRFATIDYAPLPQIIGLPFIAAALAAFSIRWGYSRISSIICLSFIVCNPFFLENISYRFDGMIMECAVACAIMPFALPFFLPEHSRKSLMPWQLLALFSCLNLYQPALNVYLCLCCLTAILSLLEKKKAGQVANMLIANAITLSLALLIYKLETLILPGGDDYADAHKQTVHSISQIFGNIPGFFQTIAPALIKGPQSIIFSAIIVSGCITLVFRAVRMLRTGSLTPAAGGLVAFCLVALPFCIPGILLLLGCPIHSHRVMIGFGSAAACFITFLLGVAPSFRWRATCLACILAGYGLWSEITLSAAYANALSAQSRFRDQMAQSMVDDAVQLAREAGQPEGASFWWGTRGDEPVAPLALYILRKYEILTDIVLVSYVPPLPAPWMMHDIMLTHGLPANILSTGGMPDRGKSMWKAQQADLQHCAINGSREHGPFITYRIGNSIIVDYDKRCVLHGNGYERVPSPRQNVFHGRMVESSR